MSGNQALAINSNVAPDADLEITTHGSDWYFAVTAVMAVSTLVFMGLAFTKPRSQRLFHYITAAITMVATIAYFSMGSGLGQVPIAAEFFRPGSSEVYGAVAPDGTREIFYVRYIDWFVTTPLLLLDLLLTAGMPWPTILITILADEIMIVTGLVGALTSSSYKWGYWTFGMFAFFYVVYSLVFIGRSHARALGDGPYKAFLSCGVWTVFLWFLYPIAWGVSEGGNVIHPDSEAVFYGVLDLMAKPVFGALLLWGHRNITTADLGLTILDYTETPARNPKNEKAGLQNDYGTPANGTNGVTGTTATNGTTTTV